jgi:hypothetical protein
MHETGEPEVSEARSELGARDVMVAGMGFCLPGVEQPVCTADELWEVASEGRSCLTNDGIYHGSIKITKEELRKRIPGIPDTFSKHFTKAHWFGLVSLVQALADAGLDIMAGDLTDAAILAGRGSIDANIDSYLRILHADAETITAPEAMDLYVGSEQSGTPVRRRAGAVRAGPLHGAVLHREHRLRVGRRASGQRLHDDRHRHVRHRRRHWRRPHECRAGAQGPVVASGRTASDRELGRSHGGAAYLRPPYAPV